MTAILLSGGMDSASIAWLHRPSKAIFVDYGQLPAKGELRAAEFVSSRLEIPLSIVKIDCSSIGSGTLSGKPRLACAPAAEWWPFRNQLLATLAATQAVSMGATRLLFGAIRTDGYHVDGTPEFFEKLNAVFSIQEGKIEIQAPGIGLFGAELAKKAGTPADLLLATHSCHVYDFACGLCGGCTKRASILQELGIEF